MNLQIHDTPQICGDREICPRKARPRERSITPTSLISRSQKPIQAKQWLFPETLENRMMHTTTSHQSLTHSMHWGKAISPPWLVLRRINLTSPQHAPQSKKKKKKTFRPCAELTIEQSCSQNHHGSKTSSELVMTNSRVPRGIRPVRTGSIK